MTSEGTGVKKELKRENLEESQEVSQSNIQNSHFTYYAKHEIELEGSALKRQLVKRFYARKLTLRKKHDTSFAPDEFTKICEGLKAQPSLRSITYSSTHYRDGEDQTLYKISQLIKRHPVLKIINIKNNGKVTDLGVQEVSQALKSMKSLQKLDLEFESLKITDKGVKSLGESFKMLSLLNQLKLNLSISEITDQGLKVLSKYVKKLNCLNDIAFNFSSPEVTSEGFNYLIQTLQKFSLEKLSLEFSDGITDKELENLSKILKNHPLKKLLLDFSGCEELTDDGLEYISQSLKELELLQNVNLHFMGCSRLCLAGSIITQSLLKLPRIEIIDLDFTDCEIYMDENQEILSKIPTIKFLHAFGS